MLGGGGANSGELSKGVGGPFGRLTLFNTATYQSYWIATTQRRVSGERGHESEAVVQMQLWSVFPR